MRFLDRHRAEYTPDYLIKSFLGKNTIVTVVNDELNVGPIYKGIHDVIKSVMLTYTDQTAKRMRKGKDAIPPRYLKLSGKPLGTTGKPSADSRAIDCLSA